MAKAHRDQLWSWRVRDTGTRRSAGVTVLSYGLRMRPSTPARIAARQIAALDDQVVGITGHADHLDLRPDRAHASGQLTTVNGRGKLKRITSPGCAAPFLPRAISTAD